MGGREKKGVVVLGGNGFFVDFCLDLFLWWAK